LKNRKEYVLCENEKGRIWRISKRLCRIKHGAGFRFISKVLHLHTTENRFWFKWSNISTTTTVQGTVSFSIKDGKIKITTKNKGSYNCSYTQLAIFNNLGQKVNAKINRVLNKEFGLKFKIGKPFYINVLNQRYPLYTTLYKSPTFHMVKVFKKASVKESIRSYCGFGGKKLISNLLQYSEYEQKQKLDIIKFLRKHLTFGEIDVARVRYVDLADTTKEFLDKNPTLFKKFLMQDHPVPPADKKKDPLDFSDIIIIRTDAPYVASWVLADTIQTYQAITHNGDIDLESTDLAFSKAKDLQKYHDDLAAFHRKLRDPKVDFQRYDFDGAKIGDFTVEVCKDSHQLIDWSTYMSNCVSSYRSRILDGDIAMCGLFKDDKLVYNLSLRVTPEGKIRLDQLNNRYNKGYDKGNLALVETFIQEQNRVLSRQKETANS